MVMVNQRALRSFTGGQMITTSGIVAAKDYLPKLADTCSATGTSKCFQSGDARTTENLGLSGLHTLFLREHNRIANKLAVVNVAWTDEILFQETRKIVIGLYQNIVYNQYVPGVIGFQGSATYGITPIASSTTSSTYFTGYNSTVRFI